MERNPWIENRIAKKIKDNKFRLVVLKTERAKAAVVDSPYTILVTPDMSLSEIEDKVDEKIKHPSDLDYLLGVCKVFGADTAIIE